MQVLRGFESLTLRQFQCRYQRESRLVWEQRFATRLRHISSRTRSSEGQSRLLITTWSGVQVPPGPPIAMSRMLRVASGWRHHPKDMRGLRSADWTNWRWRCVRPLNASVVQRQNASLPSWSRGFDSLRMLHPALWCSGSTAPFEGVRTGPNPVWASKGDSTWTK